MSEIIIAFLVIAGLLAAVNIVSNSKNKKEEAPVEVSEPPKEKEIPYERRYSHIGRRLTDFQNAVRNGEMSVEDYTSYLAERWKVK